MGSFAYTCAISGLPIHYGDKIRYMLLTQSPYCQGKEQGAYQCYVNGRWFPRTFPVRAKYNDYGDAENLQGESQLAAWRKGFDVDLIEHGWGDNSVHDKATNKTMTLAELLDCIHGGRLYVHDQVSRFSPDQKKSRWAKVPLWIPTRKRVEKRLRKLGYAMYGGNYGSDALEVSRLDGMTVRVRLSAYTPDPDVASAALTKIRDQLAKHWAGVVTCGTKTFSYSAELRLFPRPGKDAKHERIVHAPKGEKRRVLPIAHVMIREDVWQAICAQPLNSAWEEPQSIGKWIKESKAYWEKCVAMATDANKKIADAKASGNDKLTEAADLRRLINQVSMMVNHDDFIGRHIRGIPFTVGIEENWRWMVEAAADGKVTPEEACDFYTGVGEFLYVQMWFATVRGCWNPTGSGPQFGDFETHHKFLSALTNVAYQRALEQHEIEKHDGDMNDNELAHNMNEDVPAHNMSTNEPPHV